ncbi:hypothetical protein FRACYDRAFT_244402 [Fragilariopsis cylindrus CCMP1102]|uniref:Uncharacterized protein n=1 Tax=Fragilariopsis cylindrus CCMP1102 TaxID=635003 RepID=A0A1E7F1P9_9STRA|nr:hypothetical protein FRACYDRAFT_244402 [Fragilariopsis cylindrus CCMP1102]|eukprot:OEU12141.1 hypothetical protein FRACYDRAFT_244402 [Fragilariopsis cylindrus CCMP1102]
MSSVCITKNNTNTKSSLSKRTKRKKKRKNKTKKKKHDYGHTPTAYPRAATVVTLDHVPDLILDLETAVIVNAKRPMRALQMLFKLSSSSSGPTSSSNTNTTRIGMVHQKMIDNNDGNDNERYRYGQQLVLTLLKYIKRCTPQSNEHNLALIVLNNLSIPPENKKTIALDCNGIEILSKLLCEDPSCHLIAIVLVNLTYDFGGGGGGGIIRLSILMAKDQQLRSSSHQQPSTKEEILLQLRSNEEELQQLDKLSATLHVPIATSSCESSTTASSSSSSSNTTMTNNDNNKNGPYSNNNNLTLLLQDTAISIILNLSACTKSREYMNEPETIRVLTTQCNNGNNMCFQRLKARMALSYLIGSQGHFGQPKLRSIASTVQANRKNSALILSSHTEVDLLLELLVNTLYHRGKDNNNSGGGGGYLVGAFNLKCVLFSLRCLLTHTTNQETIAKSIGLDLNTILMNILARYAFDEKEDGRSIIDSDSAEHIVFCLYLQSNYGFAGFGDQEMSSFLPDMYAPPPSRILDDVDHGLAANILTTYLRSSEDNNNKSDAGVKTSAGCHAAKELLLRLKYMNFRNHNPNACRKTCRVIPEGLKINYVLLAKIKRVRIPDRKHGSKPNPVIFHHPVLRYQKPLSTKSGRMPLWNNYNPAAVSIFANALLAVQQLSYGSIKGRRSSQHRSSSVPIDDIAIANKIVHCANNKMEVCYNFMWAWEDFKIKDTHEDEDEDDDMRESNKSKFTSQGLFGCVEGIDSHIPIKSRAIQKPLGPMSFWGGVICCAMDDSMNGDDDDDTTLYTR